MNIFIDIETIPSQRDESRAAVSKKIKPPAAVPNGIALLATDQGTPAARKKAQAEIDAWPAKRLALEEQAWQDTSKSASGWGEICVIGWAIEEEEVQTASRATVDEDEATVLREFFEGVMSKRTANTRPITWIGHNHTTFDLRFLWHRAVILGVRPPFHLHQDAAPWSHTIDDTQQMWAGNRGYVGLVALCEILGIDVGHNDTIDGSQVWSEFQAGHIDTIARHCVADVERTRECWRRMTFQ